MDPGVVAWVFFPSSVMTDGTGVGACWWCLRTLEPRGGTSRVGGGGGQGIPVKMRTTAVASRFSCGGGRRQLFPDVWLQVSLSVVPHGMRGIDGGGRGEGERAGVVFGDGNLLSALLR